MKSEFHSGFSVTEVLVATMLLGIVAVGSVGILSNSFKHSRENQVIQDQSSLGNYFLQNTDCDKTTEDPSYSPACLSNQAVHLKDKSGKVILDAAGAKFDRIFVTSKCDKGQIFLSAQKDAGSSKLLLGGVPIICAPKKLPPICANLVAKRKTPASCEVEITKGAAGGEIEAVFVNAQQVASNDAPSYKFDVPCPAKGAQISGFVKNQTAQGLCVTQPVPDAPDPVSSDCQIDVVRQGNSGSCIITVSGLGSQFPKLSSVAINTRTVARVSKLAFKVQNVTWQDLGSEKFSTVATCPAANVDTVFKVESVVPGATKSCAVAVRAWSVFIGANLGDGYNQHWFVQNAIKASVSSTFPHNNQGSAMHCGNPTMQRVAFENQYKSFAGKSCVGNKGRCGFTSCGDNYYAQWNGSRWIHASACNNGCWTGYVTIVEPQPATYVPKP